MINNSSIAKWDRLKQKNLDTQFVNNIINGLNCSAFEAKAILNTVYDVYQPYFDTTGTIKPGQMLFEVVSVKNSPAKKLSDCELVTVTITMDAGINDLDIKKEQGVSGLRQHRLQRICNETFQQGGLLTVEDIAHRLLNCGERTINRDIAKLKQKNIILPLRSTIKDMGRTLSHRVMIVKQWLQGKEYSVVSRNTSHSIDAVKNYVDKFKRTVCLINENYEYNTIAFLVKISADLVKEYHNIYQNNDMVLHRKDELNNLIQKKIL